MINYLLIDLIFKQFFSSHMQWLTMKNEITQKSLKSIDIIKNVAN